MKKTIVLLSSLLLVLAGCGSSESHKSTDPGVTIFSSSGLEGFWQLSFAAQSSSGEASSVTQPAAQSTKVRAQTLNEVLPIAGNSDYKNDYPEAVASYAFLDIKANGDLYVQMFGFYKSGKPDETENMNEKFGTLSFLSQNQWALNLSDEMIARARKDGATEEDIRWALAHPCVVNVTSRSELNMACPEKEDPSQYKPGAAFNKVATDVANKTMTDAHAAADFANNERQRLATLLGGKSFVLVERYTEYLRDGDKTPTKYSADISKMPDEVMDPTSNKVSYVNAKRIQFSADFKAVMVNEKWNDRNGVYALANLKDVNLAFIRSVSDNESHYDASGVLVLKNDGFELLSGGTYGKDHYSTKSVYKLK